MECILKMLKLRINDAVLLAISIGIIGCCSGPFHAFGMDFGNVGKTGPSNFGVDVSICQGKYKIPINSDIYTTVKKNFTHFDMSGFLNPSASAELTNNGETFFLEVIFDEVPTIKGGPLESMGTYKFAHINFEWGDIFKVKGYDQMSAEIHLIFYSAQYFTVNEASKYSGGVAVMAFSYKDDIIENHIYNELIALLAQVSEPDMRAPFVNPLNLTDLIPLDPYFYVAYDGSLLTRPCGQKVIWMDFEEAISITTSQYLKLGNYFKQRNIKQNPELNTTIYEFVPGSLPQKSPDQGIPVVYSISRANARYLTAIETWFIFLFFGVFM